MANPAKRLAHNAPGAFFVDESCIDCDTCRWLAPLTFDAREGQASVARQPRDESERKRALMALVSCPTGSIGTDPKLDPKPGIEALPEPLSERVYLTGYHHEASFGAASYLIRRPGGNVLVDSPRFTRPLLSRLEALGGVRYLILTHRDDVADHAQYQRHFGCERVLHRRDMVADTRSVEILVEGDEPQRLADGLRMIPTPGHTKGSMCLLFEEHLFTGDHLAFSPRLRHLYAFRSACWYDWSIQIGSMERLAAERFSWVLPGHGRRCQIDAGTAPREIARAVAWMRRAA